MRNQNLVEKMQEISKSLNSVKDLVTEFKDEVVAIRKSETDRFSKMTYADLESSCRLLINQLKNTMKNELNDFSAILKYGKSFNELQGAMLELNRYNNDDSKNMKIYSSSSTEVYMLMNKNDVKIGTACFGIRVNTMPKSIKFTMKADYHGDYSISTTFGELSFKCGRLKYDSLYDSDYNELLKSHIDDEPEKFIINLIKEFRSMNDDTLLFPEFNNSDPLLDYDGDHIVNSGIMALLRVTNGYTRIYSLATVKNNEFNYESNGDLTDEFYNWTKRFFIENDGEVRGFIGVDRGHRGSVLLRIADRYAIGFNHPSLQLYLIEPCEEDTDRDSYYQEERFDYCRLITIKSCFFAREFGKNDPEWTREEIRMDLDESIKSELNSIDLKKFMNKFMKLIAIAAYSDRWNEIIEFAFNVKDNLDGDDEVVNFTNMLKFFVNEYEFRV